MIFSGGGGSSPLNFKVLGGTSAPANPRENTIWVNTDTEITSWVFSATEPETKTEGMVWITTGAASAAAFNVLKKNGLQVYPVSAKQYTGSTWTAKSASVYTSGKWVNLWDNYAYKAGNEYTDVTGGWKGYAYRRVNEVYASTPSVTKGTSTMSVQVGGRWWNPDQSANNWYSGTLFTEKAIDISAYSKLKINITGISGNADKIWLGVSSDKKDCFTKLAEIQAGSTGTNTLDVSSIKQAVYLYVAIHFPPDTTTVTFDKIWLE